MGPQLSRLPRKELQRVYDLAVEMSYANEYMEHDEETGEALGRDLDVVKALEKIRETFQLKGEPAQELTRPRKRKPKESVRG